MAGESVGNCVLIEEPTPFKQGSCAELESQLRETIARGGDIELLNLPTSEVLQFFVDAGQGDSPSAQQLRRSSETHTLVHRHSGFLAIAYSGAGALVKSTSVISESFRLELYRGDRIRLIFGGSAADEPRLVEAYAARKLWAQRLGFSSVGEINSAIISGGRAKTLVQLSEALHDHQVASIASQITGVLGGADAAGGSSKRLILIAGPSSSGKTTFAKRLSVALETLGSRPVVVSVDSYYRHWQEIDPRGMQHVDWESLQSLNLDLLNEHLLALLAGNEVLVPEYDMKTSAPMSREHWQPMRLPPGGVVIMEGIHCLNPALTPRVPAADKFQIMISPLSGTRVDNLYLVSSTQLRMVRRMVRDFLFRGRSALSTLRQWPGVALGEVRNIYPHQNNADAVMNSGLCYELNVLRAYAEPLLHTITPDLPEYGEARRLLAMLSVHSTMPSTLVPPQSLLREFIGGSWFYDYNGLFQNA